MGLLFGLVASIAVWLAVFWVVLMLLGCVKNPQRRSSLRIASPEIHIYMHNIATNESEEVSREVGRVKFRSPD